MRLTKIFVIFILIMILNTSFINAELVILTDQNCNNFDNQEIKIASTNQGAVSSFSISDQMKIKDSSNFVLDKNIPSGRYTTDLFTGSATYVYPINVLEGINGLTPSIFLSYNHQQTAIKGIMGNGWSMPISYIYRDINGTLNDESKHMFRLNFQGVNSKLIYSEESEKYHTEIENHLRIERKQTISNNKGEFWLITTSDGVKYRFGYLANSELVSNQKNFVSIWYIDQIEDTYGNIISFRYNQNLGEDNYPYLVEIEYGSNKIIFDYEESDFNGVNGYFYGTKIKQNSLLKGIRLLNNDKLVRKYGLEYISVDYLKLLERIQIYGSNEYIDPETSLISSDIPPVEFSYNLADKTWSLTNEFTLPPEFDLSDSGDSGFRFIDINNDGYDDILFMKSTSDLTYWLNDQKGGWGEKQVVSGILDGGFVDNNGFDEGVRFFDATNNFNPNIIKLSEKNGNLFQKNLEYTDSGWEEKNLNLPSELSFVKKGSSFTMQTTELLKNQNLENNNCDFDTFNIYESRYLPYQEERSLEEEDLNYLESEIPTYDFNNLELSHRTENSNVYRINKTTYIAKTSSRPINMLNSDGVYKPYTEVTKFYFEEGSLFLEWNDKKVELEIFVKKENDDFLLSEVDSFIENKLDFKTEIINLEKLYYYDHTLNAEGISRVSYKIKPTNVECSFENLLLICEEQVIDFSEAFYEQNLSVTASDNEGSFMVSSINNNLMYIHFEGEDLSYIDPVVSKRTYDTVEIEKYGNSYYTYWDPSTMYIEYMSSTEEIIGVLDFMIRPQDVPHNAIIHHAILNYYGRGGRLRFFDYYSGARSLWHEWTNYCNRDADCFFDDVFRRRRRICSTQTLSSSWNWHEVDLNNGDCINIARSRSNGNKHFKIGLLQGRSGETSSIDIRWSSWRNEPELHIIFSMPECQNGEEGCGVNNPNNYFKCIDHKWVDQGKTLGYCNVHCLSGNRCVNGEYQECSSDYYWINYGRIAGKCDVENSDTGVRLFDINGNGLTDIIQLNDKVQKVWLNTGDGFKLSTDWEIPSEAIFVNSQKNDDQGLRIFDVNGDGLPDLVKGKADERKTWLNTGNGFVLSNDWTLPTDATFVKNNENTGVFFVDLNGNGLQDLVKSNENKKIFWLNKGKGWVRDDSWDLPDIDFSSSSLILADLNSNGLSEIIYSKSSSNNKVWKSNIEKNYFLKQIKNSFGGITEINYQPISEFNVVDNFPVKGWVVESIKNDNGLTGKFKNIFETKYQYRGGLFDKEDREFRGFSQTNTIFSDGSMIQNYFYQDKARKGLEKGKIFIDSDGNIKNKVEMNVTYIKDLNYKVKLNSVKNYIYDGTEFPVITKTKYEYDDFGNIIKVIDKGDLNKISDKIIYLFEYEYNFENWILNNVIRTEVLNYEEEKIKESFFEYNSKGSLIKSEFWLDTGENPINNYKYNKYGNLILKINPKLSEKSYEYDSENINLIKIINSLGHENIFDYDIHNNLISEKDPNGYEIKYLYDIYGRLIKQIEPYDTENLPTKEIQYFFDSYAPNKIKTILKINPNKYKEVYSYYDGFGNLIQQKQTGNSGKFITINNYFNEKGLIEEKEIPFYSSTSDFSHEHTSKIIRYEYDSMDRVIEKINLDGTKKVFEYSYFKDSYYDENQNRIDFKKDIRGNIISVVEYNGPETYETRYEYDTLGNIIKITDNQNNEIHFIYDSLGRKISLIDRNLGITTYEYDLVNNVISETDNSGNEIIFEYDSLDRIKKIITNSMKTVYIYDDIVGTLSKVYDDNTEKNFFYDERLRVVKENVLIDDFNFTTEFEYDFIDNLISKILPNGNIINYNYNDENMISSIGDIINHVQYNIYGQIEKLNYYNNLETEFNYYSENLKLKEIITDDKQNLKYVYDSVGNIINVEDKVYDKSTSYVYDNLNRLIKVIGDYILKYNYDSIGNMLSVDGNQSKTFMFSNFPIHSPQKIIFQNGKSCLLPWGGFISHNVEVKAFKFRSVECGNVCKFEKRICDNGVLQGSYINKECTQDCEECIPDWSCGNWGSCFGGTKYRSCIDLNKCGISEGKPTTEKECEIQCYPNWECNFWSECNNGLKNRECFDRNKCNVNDNKPIIEKNCEEIKELNNSIILKQGWNLISLPHVSEIGNEPFFTEENTINLTDYKINMQNEKRIQLSKGWNEFGASFSDSIHISDLVIFYEKYYNYTEAVKNGLIKANLYSYKGDEIIIPINTEYIMPSLGYRIYAYEEIDLVFNNYETNNILWDNILVNNTNKDVLEEELIEQYTYRYDAHSMKYIYVPDDEVYLKPWFAYWIYAKQDAEIFY